MLSSNGRSYANTYQYPPTLPHTHTHTHQINKYFVYWIFVSITFLFHTGILSHQFILFTLSFNVYLSVSYSSSFSFPYSSTCSLENTSSSCKTILFCYHIQKVNEFYYPACCLVMFIPFAHVHYS